MQYRAEVFRVAPDSIAEELGICPGDIICTINGRRIADFLDYQFLSASEEIVLTVQKKNGETIEFEIENEDMEDLGIEFSGMLFDPAKSCSNRCVFCFIDQLPKGLRKSLYFKDDDSRLSFLYGNYVTMTNMPECEVDRLIEYRVSPVNISVHTTDMELRKKMLKNPQADRLMGYMKKLYEGEIHMNMQIVLCKGLNDGEVLKKSLLDLSGFHPMAISVSVVPVGLTDYREGLYPLEAFTKEDALSVVRMVEALQQEFLQKFGSRFVYLSDEFYLLAELPMPSEEAYEDFPQIENGVGMEASLEAEFLRALEEDLPLSFEGKTIIATGKLAEPFMKKLIEIAKKRYPNLDVTVLGIENHLFGKGVTVAGLLGGRDLIRELSGREFDRLMITRSMLKADEDIFLDDVTVREVEEALGVSLITNQNDGYDFLRALLGCEDSI